MSKGLQIIFALVGTVVIVRPLTVSAASTAANHLTSLYEPKSPCTSSRYFCSPKNATKDCCGNSCVPLVNPTVDEPTLRRVLEAVGLGNGETDLDLRFVYVCSNRGSKRVRRNFKDSTLLTKIGSLLGNITLSPSSPIPPTTSTASPPPPTSFTSTSILTPFPT